jgi:hypothetical protein
VRVPTRHQPSPKLPNKATGKLTMKMTRVIIWGAD